jgi:hypothetical protein
MADCFQCGHAISHPQQCMRFQFLHILASSGLCRVSFVYGHSSRYGFDLCVPDVNDAGCLFLFILAICLYFWRMSIHTLCPDFKWIICICIIIITDFLRFLHIFLTRIWWVRYDLLQRLNLKSCKSQASNTRCTQQRKK